ncbi:uncharacterized protein DDB_G0271670-like [Crassostrea angulata]|uniref:uncharacterized protein DDB_G0271670-like n=1 Tax=Magallana angulata TaxID=2784310 RepID=UPI0022B1C604|nr:uncharacterized protein DDB_G0271670-like [Crassostrea angulata]XP_052673564.1 uncharacterized protein DDB_G0271670-like [Crassostrea angulata]
MDMRRTASVFMIWNAICVYVDSCTFPSVLEGKTWEDSDKGQPVTFSGSDMLGWNVSAFSTVMNQWECLFNQNDIIVSKSSFVFGLPFAPPVTYYVYICMWIVSLDSDKFIYYLLADFISDLNTRAYRNTEDNLGPCHVCKLSLSLVPADAKVMTSTGSPSEITIPPQSGPCSGCSCIPSSTSSSTTSTESGQQSSSTTSTESGQQSSSTTSTESGQQSSITVSTDSGQQSSSTTSTESGQQSSSTTSTESGQQSSSTVSTDSGQQSSSTVSTESGQKSSSTVSTESGQQSSSTSSTDSGQQNSSTVSTGSNQAKEPADGFNTVFVAPIVIGISVLIAAVVSVILFKSKKRKSKTGAKKINVCTA